MLITQDTISKLTTVNIAPFKRQWSDSVMVTKLGAQLVEDNLKDSCKIVYALFNSDDITVEMGVIDINSEDYDSINDNASIFNMAATKKGLTILA